MITVHLINYACNPSDDSLEALLIPEPSKSEEEMIDWHAESYGIKNYCRLVRAENRAIRREFERKKAQDAAFEVSFAVTLFSFPHFLKLTSQTI